MALRTRTSSTGTRRRLPARLVRASKPANAIEAYSISVVICSWALVIPVPMFTVAVELLEPSGVTDEGVTVHVALLGSVPQVKVVAAL
jgi:hypothetical protein